MSIPKTSFQRVHKTKSGCGISWVDMAQPWHVVVVEVHLLGYNRETYEPGHPGFYCGPGGDTQYNRGVVFEGKAMRAGFVTEMCLNREKLPNVEIGGGVGSFTAALRVYNKKTALRSGLLFCYENASALLLLNPSRILRFVIPEG